MQSPQMVATSLCMCSLGSTLKEKCIFSTVAEANLLGRMDREAFCNLVAEWKPVGWAEEKGQISAGVGPALERRQRERQAYCYREQFPTRGDKAVRAQSIRGRMALEGLYVPTHASWCPAFRSELLSFPAGKHDDQVDALGLVGQLLDQMVPGQAPQPPAPVKIDTGYKPYVSPDRLTTGLRTNLPRSKRWRRQDEAR
jgi:predicted phage terminase large subunit-like protein